MNETFARFARQERIASAVLVEAVERADRGLIDADLGGGVIKQRIARTGRGRSGGYRTIVLLRFGSRAIFAYGFAKKDRANIDRAELKALKDIARKLLAYDEREIERAVSHGTLIEVRDE